MSPNTLFDEEGVLVIQKTSARSDIHRGSFIAAPPNYARYALDRRLFNYPGDGVGYLHGP